jgi:NitT/TauT family transport system substrate-binding protein
MVHIVPTNRIASQEREMKKLVLETTAPYQGLPELVAYDEGLFAKEGLAVEWADRDSVRAKKDGSSITARHIEADPFTAHGKLLEQGKADMYNACEWGNYCRVGSTAVGSRQVGRRAIVTFVGIVVGQNSAIYTPQQLAGQQVGVTFYAGSHYLALHLLSGFLPRDQINVCNVGAGGAQPLRLKMVMSGELAACALNEPYISLAEKLGCRVVASAFHHGTEVASDRVDADTYAAFNRAVREAVRRINANKAAYLHYFIDYHKEKDPQVAMLTVADLREGRLQVCDPAPIPTDEMSRTYEWVRSWGMLENTDIPQQLVNLEVQSRAHAAVQ